jgi:hypothetical protein
LNHNRAVTLDIAEHGAACKVFRTSPFEAWRVERTTRRAGGPDARRFPPTELVPGGYVTSACSPLVYNAFLTRLASLVGAAGSDADLGSALALLGTPGKGITSFQVAILDGLGQGLRNSGRPLSRRRTALQAVARP